MSENTSEATAIKDFETHPEAFVKEQQQKLLDLRDRLVGTMAGMARDNLRNENGDSSAFGMHQADAGTDAYDRDFALNLLSQEQDALCEIEEALQRVKEGRYGVCESSKKLIMKERLQAIPFTRYTVECQEEFEKNQLRHPDRRSVRSLFGLTDSDKDGDSSARSQD